MERYSEYKNSGVKWLGQIPSHWEVKKLRAALTERKERFNISESLIILSLIKDKGIIPYDEKGEVGNKSKDDYTQYKVARRGDLVINSMNVIIGSLGITPYDGYISPAYYAFEPKSGINLSYYIYLLSLRKVQQSIRCFSKGIMEIRLKISSYDFLSMPFPFPNLEEQNIIVNYLDIATSKIDAAIAQQQKMIDLLNERKQIIINNSVTKGLDPNVKMKPSGIDWIGDIPKHWTILPLKYCATTNSGSTPRTIAGKDNQYSNIRWVRTTDLKNDVVYDTSEYLSYKEMQSASCPLLPKDTVLISMYGGAGSFGKLGILNMEATINQALCSISCKKAILPKYMFYYLQSIRPVWMKYAESTRKDPNLNQQTIRNISVLLPSINEQKKIVEYIENMTIGLNASCDKINQQISLLQERKQVIINDVVTGKVKVV